MDIYGVILIFTLGVIAGFIATAVILALPMADEIREVYLPLLECDIIKESAFEFKTWYAEQYYERECKT